MAELVLLSELSSLALPFDPYHCGQWDCARRNIINLDIFPSFVWEECRDRSRATDKPRLLAVREDYELRVYEFDLKDGRCESTLLHSCCGRTLQKLVEDRGVCECPAKFALLLFPS